MCYIELGFVVMDKGVLTDRIYIGESVEISCGSFPNFSPSLIVIGKERCVSNVVA